MAKPRKPNRPIETSAAQRRPGGREPITPDSGNALRKRRPRTRTPIETVTEDPELRRKQEAIWKKATTFCAWNLPTLWTAGEPRQESDRRWIVPIILRYSDGHQGQLGEMAFDEQRQEFSLMADKTDLAERARILAASRPSHGENAAPSEAGA